MDSLAKQALAFKALGDPTRLQIFEYLRSCSKPVEVDSQGDVRPVCGSTVGEVCCHLYGETKTLPKISFHLKELKNAGLITMERRGKNILCAIDPETLEALGRFFLETKACDMEHCA